MYLDPLDHFCTDGSRFPRTAYLRYMDDFVCLAHDRESLKEMRESIKDFVGDYLGLKLKAKATFLNQRSNGLSFLGRRVFPKLIRHHPANLRRAIQKIEAKEAAFARGEMEETAFWHSMNSSWAHLSDFDTYQLRKTYLGRSAAKPTIV